MSSCIRVLVISPVTLYRQGLCALLGALSGVELAGAIGDINAAPVDTLQPVDVVLMDATLVSVLGVVAVRNALPRARVVAIAVQHSDTAIVTCAEAGVDSLIAADTTAEGLQEALHHIAVGNISLSTAVAVALFRHIARAAREEPLPAQLTAREAEIIALVDAGLSNKQIAARLSLTVPTVKNH